VKNKERCCSLVYDAHCYVPQRCSRNASVVRDEKHYCRQHDPKAIEERNRQAQAKWDQASQKRIDEWERDAAMDQLCEGVDTSDLKRLGRGWLKAKIIVERSDHDSETHQQGS
jgi:hypothetical protein